MRFFKNRHVNGEDSSYLSGADFSGQEHNFECYFLEPLISKSRVVRSFYRFYRSFLDDSPSPSHISGEIDPAEPWPQPAPWPQPLDEPLGAPGNGRQRCDDEIPTPPIQGR